MMWLEVTVIAFALSFFSAKSQCELSYSFVSTAAFNCYWSFVVSVTWNGTTITGPVLIYSDELPVDPSATTTGDPNEPGALICKSEDRAAVSWHYTPGQIVRGPEHTDTFKATSTGTGIIPSVSRLLLNKVNTEVNNNDLNGLWHCRLNGVKETDQISNNQYDEQINVGIFSRGKFKLRHGLTTTRV